MQKNEKLYSYHTFMFPFRFDKVLFTKDNKAFSDKHEFYKSYTFDERVVIDENFKKSLEQDSWNYQKFTVKNNLDYNELVYFYDFVQDSLFNTNDFESNATSYFFEKQNINDEYSIKIKNKDSYDLQLTGITLRIFDSGIGILGFETENNKYDRLEDIFNINEYGRRIYPQFVSENFDLKNVQENFLAESITVNGIKETFTLSENKSIRIADFVLKTLGQSFTIALDKKDKYLIQPLLDDRMYVVSHIMHNDFSKEVQSDLTDKWYQYTFVDKLGSKMIQNKQMQESLIKQATYTRWQEYGTLYGVSRYSFVLLSDESDFSKDHLNNHIKTIYFQMVTLSLVARASILRFSDEITALSDIKAQEKDLTNKISELYRNYLRFKNKLFFKEITPQEQGIELYDKMREIMRIDEDIKDLSQEISSLNNYAYLISEQDEKEQMNKLTKLGTIFLPSTLVAGFFGMNVFPSGWIDNITGFSLSILIMICLTWFISKKIRLT